MSCLDCSCILRTQVESFGAEKQSDSSSSEDLTDEPVVCWSQPTQIGDEQILWSSDVSHYDIQMEIGKGSNNLTSIYLARHIPTGTLVAVKITDLEKCSEEHLNALQNEVILSHSFRHPNILTLCAVFTSGSWLWIISPFMAYGSASHLLRTYFPEGMSEALIGNILFGAIRGLSYMHQHGYIHRNIKASHILISGDGLVYLSGFNHLCSLVSSGQRLKAVYDFPQFSTSMLPWLSPELLRQDLYGYNVKSDIYSVGITACELANGHVPFQDMPRTQMLLQKLKGPSYCPWATNTFPRGESRIKNSRSGIDSGIGESMTRTMTSERLQTPPKTFSPAFHNLIELCLHQDPEKRASKGTGQGAQDHSVRSSSMDPASARRTTNENGSCYKFRPSARGLLSHAFFKQVKEQTKGSFLSLLPPPIQYTPSQTAAVPSAAIWTQPGGSWPSGREMYWES